jgi:hypothetical protein
MDKTEAAAVLDQHLASFVRLGYAELAAMVDRPQGMQTEGASGAKYNIEFNVFYDDLHRKQICVSWDRLTMAVDAARCFPSQKTRL